MITIKRVEMPNDVGTNVHVSAGFGNTMLKNCRANAMFDKESPGEVSIQVVSRGLTGEELSVVLDMLVANIK